ncbi:MAG: PC4/YdbC family ssDNA-binding protein [Eubacteriales bacterium]|nr:PC4/YdbC family ssDNA-binding protein [Eubacteriales bacterium]MDD4390304.1 PC4/YdbC family ssDNA-binding protein [Eubacteriales bacterium]
MADNFNFEIIRNLCILSTNTRTGWSKELNVISWNGREPKLDIREWNKEHTKCNKGITLTEEELAALKEAEI